MAGCLLRAGWLATAAFGHITNIAIGYADITRAASCHWYFRPHAIFAAIPPLMPFAVDAIRHYCCAADMAIGRSAFWYEPPWCYAIAISHMNTPRIRHVTPLLILPHYASLSATYYGRISMLSLRWLPLPPHADTATHTLIIAAAIDTVLHYYCIATPFYCRYADYYAAASYAIAITLAAVAILIRAPILRRCHYCHIIAVLYSYTLRFHTHYAISLIADYRFIWLITPWYYHYFHWLLMLFVWSLATLIPAISLTTPLHDCWCFRLIISWLIAIIRRPPLFIAITPCRHYSPLVAILIITTPPLPLATIVTPCCHYCHDYRAPFRWYICHGYWCHTPHYVIDGYYSPLLIRHCWSLMPMPRRQRHYAAATRFATFSSAIFAIIGYASADTPCWGRHWWYSAGQELLRLLPLILLYAMRCHAGFAAITPRLLLRHAAAADDALAAAMPPAPALPPCRCAMSCH